MVGADGDGELFHNVVIWGEPREIADVLIPVTFPSRKQISTMRLRYTSFLLVSALLLAAGCATSTPQTRISKNREAFRQYPSNVQRMISAGMVDVGFTPEMVRLALGAPSREFRRQTENESSEVWVYHDTSPRVSVGFGLGFGSYGRHSATSVGVATTTGDYDREEKMRVVFRDGHVTEIEYRKH